MADILVPEIERAMPGYEGRGGASSTRRNLARQRALLEAARSLLIEKGYAAVTVDEITKRAGTSKQTFYRWWPGKGALFLELYERVAPPGLLDVDTGSLTGDLRALLTELFAVYRETGVGRALAGLVGEMTGDPALAERMRGDYLARRRALLQSVFDRAAARGELRADADTGTAVEMLTGAIWFRLMTGTVEPDADFARRLAATMARGVLR